MANKLRVYFLNCFTVSLLRMVNDALQRISSSGVIQNSASSLFELSVTEVDLSTLSDVVVDQSF
ncbi:MAG: hypothetical protein VXX55_11590, partial [Planctomycetota bacterium]|nr:hypothetical protein [Planctomycetota bacterium]